MRIAIIGIGGVGGYFGSKLAREYTNSGKHEVIFIVKLQFRNHSTSELVS